MTKVTYIVGEKEIVSYKEARKASQLKGLPLIPKYTPIGDNKVLNKKG